MHRGGKLSDGQTRRSQKVAVHEYLSDVCCEDANDEEHKNQCGLLALAIESRLSPSLVLNRIQGSRHVQGVLRCVGERWKELEHRGEGCAGEGEYCSRVHGSQGKPRQVRQTTQEVPVPVAPPVQIVERLVEAIIDKELERREARASTGRQGHHRLVDRREERTSAGRAATLGTQAEEGAELAEETDELASHVR